MTVDLGHGEKDNYTTSKPDTVVVTLLKIING